MSIVPNIMPIQQLFSTKNERFVIPSYQRRYAWKKPHTTALFEDLDMLQAGEEHLFGLMILHSEGYNSAMQTMDVVDGQQRLTTLSLLLAAMGGAFKAHGNSEKHKEVKNLLVAGFDESNLQPKLTLGDLDDVDFQAVIKGRNVPVKNLNIAAAMVNFKELINDGIESKGIEWLNDFYNRIMYYSKVIRLDVNRAQDAYKLFETINNRGLSLSATDILKNFILGHAAKISNEVLVDVRHLWAEVIKSLDGLNTDNFFRQYTTSLVTRKTPSTRLVREFKQYYYRNVEAVDLLGEYLYNYADDNDDDEEEVETPESQRVEKISTKANSQRISIQQFLNRVALAAKTYGNIAKANFSDKKLATAVQNLRTIKSFPTYIYLMHYLSWERPIKEQRRVVQLLASVMLRRHICGRRTSENDDIFARLLRLPVGGEDYIKTLQDELLEFYPEDEEFKTSFPGFEHRGILINRAKYMLAQIEYNLTGDTGELRVNSGSDVHLEHIIPQKITTKKSKRQFGDWEEYLGKNSLIKHRKYVHRIGNMTLLAGDLNIGASNNPFSKKKKPYKKSNIKMTQELNNKRDFKFAQVDQRGEGFADLAVKIWRM